MPVTRRKTMVAKFVCADISQTGRFQATASDWAVTWASRKPKMDF
jgi:hypothetical protein